MNATPSRPTLRDVATKAGLSVTQTSRALNGHSDVAEATKLHVQAAADEIGYVPNLEARRLKMPRERSNRIGLIIPSENLKFSDAFFNQMLVGIVAEATQARYQLVLSTALPDVDACEPYDSLIRSRGVDGFIVVRLKSDDSRVSFLAEKDFPFVVFGRQRGSNEFLFVDEADDAMRPAVDHLVGLGHSRIACISEPKGYGKAFIRYRSFAQAMNLNGLQVDEELVVESEFSEDSGYEAAALLLSKDNAPTAIVALNDFFALGTIRYAAEQGISIPNDLSITGYDDIDMARLVNPGLTTLRVSAVDVGESLCSKLLSLIDGKLGLGPDIFTPELIVRGSTARPSSS